jgi:tyrosyl-tRNA synthetase
MLSDTMHAMKHPDLLTRAVSKVIPQKLAESKLASDKKLRLYWGIDPTGAKIHLGHAVSLRKMKAFADAGHEVIFLVGSFTGMIGDPTGKDTMREALTKKQVKENFETYKKQAEKILDFSKIDVRYNHEWLEKLTFEDIIKLASNFTVNQMIERDMFEKRLSEGKPIHLHEFFYPLMVGYDSVVLDVDFELGGNDQEFNMLAGRTLQQAAGKRDKCVITTKLLEGTDGRKMSKSYDNCIYLDDEPNDMYGKVMRVKDELIAQYFECCTDVSMDEVKEMENAMKKGTNPRDFKVRLAKEIVTLYHGAFAAEDAQANFQNVFTKGGTPDDLEEIKVKKGALLLDVLSEHGIIASKSEGRRLIEQGGIKMNDEAVTSIDAPAEKGIVKVGKRKFVKIA